MEYLPPFVEGQIPQSPFEALLTRISSSQEVSNLRPNARAILESFVNSQRPPTYDEKNNQSAPKPIDKFPPYDTKVAPSQLPVGEGETTGNDEILISVKRAIVNELFEAITREDNESIGLLIQYNIVTGNTTGPRGQTPLLSAILTRNIPTVKQLLELGADPNAFGQLEGSSPSVYTETRTPLMLAATYGSLPLVKLLHEPPYSANDALIAPDGQIALRLAVDNGHQQIVDYLPSRRGGGFLRYKVRNAENIARAKKALHSIYLVVKFFVWHIPKFLLWSVPKHGVVLPVIDGCKWTWRNRKKIGIWVKRQVTELPKKIWNGIKRIPKALLDIAERLVMAGLDLVKDLLDIVKKIPRGLVELGKGLWKFSTETFPSWLQSVTKWLWEMVTKRIPNAISIVFRWTWDAIHSLVLAVWDVLLKIISFLHTVFEAIITFLRNVTLRDIWIAFCDLLSSIFVDLPKVLWSWMKNFADASYEVLVALFGWVGDLIWWIGKGLYRLAIYIPRKFFTVLEAIANSMAKGAHEVWVWINPKTS